MAITVNRKCKTKARSMIAAGDVDTSSSWSFSAADGNALLGDNEDWSAYSEMHLAVDSEYGADTKEHYKYPIGKGGKIYRSGLIAVRQRAAQQGETDVYNAAGDLIEEIDGEGRQYISGREERRIVLGELRAVPGADGKPKMVCGHAAKFDVLSGDLGGFRERIAPGAFAAALTTADIRCLWNHDANIVLGRNKSGTLRLSEDSAGLYYECDAPDTALVRDMVMSPIERGDVTQCSFGFRTISDKWAKVNGEWIRTLLEVDLFDVSPVTYPAYNSTDVAVRSLKEAMSLMVPTEEEYQMELRKLRLKLATV